MSNIQENYISEVRSPAMSKIDRLQQRALRLQREAQQARERLREEESNQDKLARLKARRRVDIEIRQVGSAGWIAGLHEVRWQPASSGNGEEQPLDVDLLIGAMSLLREQMLEIAGTGQVRDLRVRGEAIRKAYLADRSNPRLSINLSPVSASNSQGDNHG